jgi:ABC-type Na+ efflux pump permease subunit
MGISRTPKEDVISEIFIILFITFILNMLCINGLNNVAWYLVIFFILIPFTLAIIAVLPLLASMISKKSTIKK